MWNVRVVRIMTGVSALALVIALVIYRASGSTGAGASITPPQTIESLESIELGGVIQWLLIRGDRTKPVLLWLHGGPGAPLMPTARSFDTELLTHFVVVHWDQRGAGKSYDPALTPAMLTPEHYIADTHELARSLCQRFTVPKIYLIGHSWGAALGALTVERSPELFYAYVGVSQLVSIPESQQVIYPRLLAQARATGYKEAIDQLEALGPPPWADVESVLIVGKWNWFFGGVLRNMTAQQLEAAQQSSVYTPEDFEKLGQGQAFSLAAMYPHILHINLFEQAQRLEVPVYFFQGRYDGQAPGELTERYYNQLEAPRGKQLIWFEESAHLPMYEEPATFNQEMVHVLAETAPGRSSE